MQKVVSYENVAFACASLKSEGEKITGRSVLAITGGDFGTVLKYIKQWREEGGSEVSTPEIPDSLTKGIKHALWQALKDGMAHSNKELQALIERETEAVKALCDSEKKVEELEKLLSASEETHQNQVKQLETQSALLGEKLSGANTRIAELIIEISERSKLVEDLQVNNAELRQVADSSEKAVMRAESKMDALQKKIDKLTREKFLLEKEVAISEAKLKMQGTEA
nr:DNA-binding protein [uncultured Desulfuromonas sp.]